MPSTAPVLYIYSRTYLIPVKQKKKKLYSIFEGIRIFVNINNEIWGAVKQARNRQKKYSL